MKNYLTRKEISEQFPISISALAHYASQGKGPKFRIIGGKAVYLRDEFEDWIEDYLIDLNQRKRQFVAMRMAKKAVRGRPRKTPLPLHV